MSNDRPPSSSRSSSGRPGGSRSSGSGSYKGTSKPGGGKPGSSRPGSGRPGSGQPGSSRPASARDGSGKSGSYRSSGSGSRPDGPNRSGSDRPGRIGPVQVGQVRGGRPAAAQGWSSGWRRKVESAGWRRQATQRRSTSGTTADDRRTAGARGEDAPCAACAARSRTRATEDRRPHAGDVDRRRFGARRSAPHGEPSVGRHPGIRPEASATEAARSRGRGRTHRCRRQTARRPPCRAAGAGLRGARPRAVPGSASGSRARS